MKVLMLVSGILGLISPWSHQAFASQDEQVSIVAFKDSSGTISSIDTQKSLVVFKSEGNSEHPPEEVSLVINSSTIIEKNNESCDLSKINSGDHVDLTYSIDESGAKKAIEISVSK